VTDGEGLAIVSPNDTSGGGSTKMSRVIFFCPFKKNTEHKITEHLNQKTELLNHIRF
jgi:hypothetical protein